jgi:hypothetical protein
VDCAMVPGRAPILWAICIVKLLVLRIGRGSGSCNARVGRLRSREGYSR